MFVKSTSFENGQPIPPIYTCSGQDINPPLIFEGLPQNTESIAIIMDDPDAPGGTFTHWLIWNIPGGTKEIAENSVPMGASLGINGFGKLDYAGPCPPSGTHRYFFRVYALDMKIALMKGAKRADLETAMRGHILTQAELMGTFSK